MPHVNACNLQAQHGIGAVLDGSRLLHRIERHRHEVGVPAHGRDAHDGRVEVTGKLAQVGNVARDGESLVLCDIAGQKLQVVDEHNRFSALLGHAGGITRDVKSAGPANSLEDFHVRGDRCTICLHAPLKRFATLLRPGRTLVQVGHLARGETLHAVRLPIAQACHRLCHEVSRRLLQRDIENVVACQGYRIGNLRCKGRLTQRGSCRQHVQAAPQAPIEHLVEPRYPCRNTWGFFGHLEQVERRFSHIGGAQRLEETCLTFRVYLLGKLAGVLAGSLQFSAQFLWVTRPHLVGVFRKPVSRIIHVDEACFFESDMGPLLCFRSRLVTVEHEDGAGTRLGARCLLDKGRNAYSAKRDSWKAQAGKCKRIHGAFNNEIAWMRQCVWIPHWLRSDFC